MYATTMRHRGVWALFVVAALVAAGCGLIVDDTAVEGSPVSTEPIADENPVPVKKKDTDDEPVVTVAPSTTSPSAPSSQAPGEGSIPGKETSTVMNISTVYKLGQPGNAECDAAYLLLIKTISLPELTRDDPPSAYVAALDEALRAVQDLVTAATGELLATARGALAVLTDVRAAVAATQDVVEIRKAINVFATAQPVNAGTVLFSIQAACPMIIQGAMAPNSLFPDVVDAG